MAIIKCKMCGGTLQFENGTSVGICEYCGTKQTLPRIDDERKANLYDRANHFRRNNDFDKAMSIYEHILNENTTDAESYWSILLCRYGIEYVEDSTTHKRIPTVNRAQFTSIFDDEDYKSALQYADGNQRKIYEAEATAINEIQRGILAISQNEEPFDVFVCYKETDNNGRRTRDSVLATELYQELTREGFKVFFSRITLEDKLGTAYEPYIFAALNTAKVMVVLGTRPEHFNAVWVKNEWSRYLALIKNGAKKVLIPAYRDMDPYDLPEEFSHLQALDMSKLGFMQDLIRGIKKIVGSDVPKTTVHENIVTSSAVANTAPLLKRAFMFLEDGEFERADDFCEQVLNQNPENARAYLGKLMVDMRVRKPAELSNCADSFAGNRNYQKAIRFADEKLAGALKKCLAAVDERNARKAEEARQESVYLKAMDDYKSYDIERLQNAIKIFASLNGYKDSEERIQQCQVKISQILVKKENDRIELERLTEQKRIADEKARLEKQRQDEIKRRNAEIKKKKNKKIATIIGTILILLITVLSLSIITVKFIIPYYHYNTAVSFMSLEKYEEAYNIFQNLGTYKDAPQQAAESLYKYACSLYNDGKYDMSNDYFIQLDNYKDSKSKIHAHKYTEHILLEAKCLEKGIKELTCYCGKTITEEINEKGHNFVENTIIRNATCEEQGEKLLLCVCGESKTETIPATGHTYSSSITQKATCENVGTKTFMCGCGKSYTEPISATGHNWISATCSKSKYCSNCGKQEGTALGHTNSAVCTRCGTNLFQSLSYSGRGHIEIELNLPQGTFKITCTLVADNTNIDMWLRHRDYFKADELLLNTYKVGTSQETIVKGPISDAYIEVQSITNKKSCDWTILIEAIG